MWGGAETYPPSPSLEGYEGWGGGAGQRKRGGGARNLVPEEVLPDGNSGLRELVPHLPWGTF